jgi:hypothetical protein
MIAGVALISKNSLSIFAKCYAIHVELADMGMVHLNLVHAKQKIFATKIPRRNKL